MDALALLCNLHADGPATFQRLRRAGCESLAALADLTLEEVATELQTDEEGARRFQREAELLVARLRGEEGALEDPTSDRRDRPEGPESEPPPGEPADSNAGDRQGHTPEVERVLARWRSLDRDAPPLPPGEFLVPRPAAGDPGNRALEEVRIEGLSRELVEGLAGLGILSLRGLRDAVTLEVARALPLAFTRVRRLQFLAGRALESALEPSGPMEATESREQGTATPASAPADPEPSRLDTAGPFA